jgi:hypothetical protein
MNKKGCYIDEDDYFRWDDDVMASWFNNAMKEIDGKELDMHNIPYMVFLMGCEAALRMKDMEKLH